MDIIANGVRLNYVEAGEGKAVVCLHELGLNQDTWRHLFPLSKQHYRTLAYVAMCFAVKRPERARAMGGLFYEERRGR